MKTTHHLIYSLGLFFCLSCAGPYVLSQADGKNQDIVAAAIDEDQEIEEIVAPYKAALESKMNKVLCQSEKGMVKARPESGLSNFFADALLQKGRSMVDRPIDAALFNHGGIRSALPAGDVQVRHIFQVMPFENELVIVELNAKGMQDIMRYLKKSGGEPVSDIRLQVKDEQIVESLVGGKAIEDRSYRILTSDYLAGGGDRMHFLTASERLSIESLGIKVRDALLEHCRNLGEKGLSIQSIEDGRIKHD